MVQPFTLARSLSNLADRVCVQSGARGADAEFVGELGCDLSIALARSHHIDGLAYYACACMLLLKPCRTLLNSIRRLNR